MGALHGDVSQVLAVDDGIPHGGLGPGVGVLLSKLPSLRAELSHATLNRLLHAAGQVAHMFVGVAAQGRVEGVDGDCYAAGACTKHLP